MISEQTGIFIKCEEDLMFDIQHDKKIYSYTKEEKESIHYAFITLYKENYSDIVKELNNTDKPNKFIFWCAKYNMLSIIE